jgi:uncharacterized membrane protein
MSTAVAPTVTRGGERWLALDLLRFFAVVLMVQGHTFNVVLSRAVRSQDWHRYHSFVHGLTAPMFLFGAGLAFGVTTFRKLDAHTRFGPATLQRLKRYGWLVVIGYALQMPSLSLLRTLALAPADVARALHVGPLQLVGVSLAVTELALLQLRTRVRLTVAVALAGLLVAFGAPLLEAVPIERVLPLGVTALLDARTGSTFPLFPWGAYLCAGIVAAHFVWDAERDGPRRGIALPLFFFGLAVCSVTYALFRLRLNIYGPHDYWRTDPQFTFFRIGVVTIVLATFVTLLGPIERARAAGLRPVPGPLLAIARIGQESLVIYVAHLLVLYGSPLWRSLRQSLGERLDLRHASIAAILLVVAMMALAHGWTILRTQRERRFELLKLSLASALLYFALRP